MIHIKPRHIIECYVCGKEIKDYEGVSIFPTFTQIELVCKACAKKWDEEQKDG